MECETVMSRDICIKYENLKITIVNRLQPKLKILYDNLALLFMSKKTSKQLDDSLSFSQKIFV
jgi:hypothetical protein